MSKFALTRSLPARDGLARSTASTRSGRLAAVCGGLFMVACSSSDPRTSDDTGDDSSDGSSDAGVVVSRLDAGPQKPSMRDATAVVSAGDAATDCVRGRYTAKARALDMFILLDQSGSMQEDEDRWTPVTNALKAFVGAPNLTRTGVAMQYFPLGLSDEIKCQSEIYEKPDVEMGDLPANTEPVRKSIDAHYFTQAECCDDELHSGTPTRPAVEGAAEYMRSWLTSHPDHVGVILLATDGEPSSVCDDNKVSNVASVLAAAASASPPVQTYVIGIGDNDALDEMATAGGTGEGALIVDGSGKQTEQQLLSALARIREEALPCDYPLDGVEDKARVNVTWTVESSGETKQLVNVPGADQCERSAATGWYYDDPAKPTRINLCPDTCSALLGDPGVTVQIVDGCETQVLL